MYKYVMFQPVKRVLDVIVQDQLWDIEGIAFISRHHLTLSASANLTMSDNSSGKENKDIMYYLSSFTI